MRLIILGRGGYGRTVRDLAEQTGLYDEILFLDDNAAEADVIGSCSAYAEHIKAGTVFYPAFGNNTGRLEWLSRLEEAGAELLTLISSETYISPRAEIGVGTVVLPRAIINTGSRVLRGCIVNCGAIIDHDCVVEEGAHICLGAIVKAENRIPACMKVEAGAVIDNRQYPL